VLAEATSALFHTDAEKKRKGVWIEIDSGDDEDDQSERSSAVASEGSTVTAAASAGSTATSGDAAGLRGWVVLLVGLGRGRGGRT